MAIKRINLQSNTKVVTAKGPGGSTTTKVDSPEIHVNIQGAYYKDPGRFFEDYCSANDTFAFSLNRVSIDSSRALESVSFAASTTRTDTADTVETLSTTVFRFYFESANTNEQLSFQATFFRAIDDTVATLDEFTIFGTDVPTAVGISTGTSDTCVLDVSSSFVEGTTRTEILTRSTDAGREYTALTMEVLAFNLLTVRNETSDNVEELRKTFSRDFRESVGKSESIQGDFTTQDYFSADYVAVTYVGTTTVLTL